MGFNIRLDWELNQALEAIKALTGGTTSGAIRWLIERGEMHHENIRSVRGSLGRIVGVKLLPAEERRLRMLAAKRGVNPGKAVRLMIRVHVTDDMKSVKTTSAAIKALAVGEVTMVLNYLHSQTPRPIDDRTPRNRRIMMWCGGGAERWRIGRYNDDRFAVKPRPFWDYEDALRICDSRDYPPLLWRELPEKPDVSLD